jgi:hypothetical protein
MAAVPVARHAPHLQAAGWGWEEPRQRPTAAPEPPPLTNTPGRARRTPIKPPIGNSRLSEGEYGGLEKSAVIARVPNATIKAILLERYLERPRTRITGYQISGVE